MSALGSSVISRYSGNFACLIGTDLRTDKSGKKFAPKAPARRSGAPTTTQTYATPSVDKQIQSQAAGQVPASSITSLLLPTSVSTQQPLIATPARTERHDKTITIPAPSHRLPDLLPSDSQDGAIPPATLPRSTQAQTRTSSRAPVDPQKRQSEPTQSQNFEATEQTAQPGQISEPERQPTAPGKPNLLYSDFSCTATDGTTLGQDTVSIPTGRSTSCTSLSPHETVDNTQAPAAKRRRIEKPQPTAPAVQSSESGADANVPCATIESNQGVTGEPHDARRGSAMPQSAKAKKPSSLARAKRLQRIEDGATAVVADATRIKVAKVRRPKKITKGKGNQVDAGEASRSAQGTALDADARVEQDAASKKRKKKITITQTIQDAAAAVVEEAVHSLSKIPKKRGRRGRQRAASLEGADAVIIAPSEVKMSDLCKDNGTGRKSEREKEIVEFEKAEYLRKKQKQLQEVIGQVEHISGPGPSESAEDPSGRLERLARQREREENVAQNVPNTIIVNGQIQIDEDSLQIDRHAAAAAARADEDVESVDENALTRKVNSATWLKRDNSGGWNELYTDRFYEGLRMFGTDFQMISKMFPGRTRHKIKLKFVREEKLNHDKIKATLLGQQIPVDLPEFEKMAGVEFDDPAELERDMAEDRKRLEEETLAEKEDMDNARRERDEQIAAERAEAGDESSAKENRRGKSKRKKGEKHKGKKGSSMRKEKHLHGEASLGGTNVLGEIGEVLEVA